MINEYHIDQVAFEDIQLQESAFNNVVTYKILAEIFGVTEELMAELKVNYQIVSSQTWKSKLEIKGKNRTEQKRNCQTWVSNFYNIKCTQDESDAIALGYSTFIESKEKKLAHHSWE